jgi:hypothetical protein
VQIGYVDISRGMLKRLRIGAVDPAPSAVYRLNPSSCRNYKRLVAAADTAQQVELIHQILGDNMNDAIRRLHPASAREYLRAHRPNLRGRRNIGEADGSFRGPSPVLARLKPSRAIRI